MWLQSFKLSPAVVIVVVGRYGLIHVGFFINVTKLILFHRLFTRIWSIFIIFRSTYKGCAIGLSVFLRDSIVSFTEILSFGRVNVKRIELIFQSSINIRTVQRVSWIVADCSLFLVNMGTYLWTWGILPMPCRVLKRLILLFLYQRISLLVQRMIVI